MIRESLAGKRLFITGTTGFLGTNLLERLLRAVPDCEIVLLVRPGKRSTVQQRVAREILKNDAFDRLRSELGKDGFAEMTARRITAVAGDVGRDGLGLDDDGRAALASCDTVIHSAATVSFDSPLDSAVEVNLLGPSRIAAVLTEMGVTPHLVAVSTCYVAGNRRGSAPEQLVDESPFFVDVDWRREVEGARQARRDAEAQSRTPEMLAEFRTHARKALGAAGTPALADKTEQNRTRWVSERMVSAGRARAASLGWPDAYAYTKALGERALVETRGDVPVSIVRPSIIETALAEPRPGWIRGFRMADPVIISYARGLLKEFPGVPEGIVDVIPVDLVSAAIIAVAAKGPEPEPEVVQVASGSQNPLRYRRLVDLVSGWFLEHPLYDAKGQPIVMPKWSFPKRGRVQDQLTRAKKTLERAENVLGALPLRGKQAEWTASIEAKTRRSRAGAELRRALRRLRGVRGGLRPRSSPGPLGRAVPRGPDGVLLRPPCHRLGRLHRQRLPARRSCNRPGSAPPPAAAPARHARTACARRCWPPSASSPPSTSRTRSSHRTSSRATRSWPLDGCLATSASASRRRCWPKGRRCSASTARTAATSFGSSTAGTTERRSSRSTRTPPRCSAG